MPMRHPNLSLPKLFLAATITAAALSTSAQANLGYVCLELPVGASVVKAEIASGCIGSGRSYSGEFDITVNADRAFISIDGSYQQAEDDFHIGTMDCMGSRMIEQEAEAAGPRRYSVVINGQYRGILDASDMLGGAQAVRQCFAQSERLGRRQEGLSTTYSQRQFADWVAAPRRDDRVKGFEISYASLAELAAALHWDHPESMEGRSSTEMTISHASWQPNNPIARLDAPFMAIQIELHGYADDSVLGKRIFAAAQLDEQSGQWTLTHQWHQVMCARGSRAGQWTDQLCD